MLIVRFGMQFRYRERNKIVKVDVTIMLFEIAISGL
jgi:hypothetical protein